MKKINFHGKEYEVEDWVNWVAIDEDGVIYGYEDEPEAGFATWINSKRFARIPESYAELWKNSLTKV